MRGTNTLRDLVAMPNRKTVVDPASQAPLPPGWTLILIVVGAAIVVVVLVALITGLVGHHPASSTQAGVVWRFAAHAVSTVATRIGR